MSHHIDALLAGIRAGDRGALARAITLIESTRPADQEPGMELLVQLQPTTAKALRIGVTGVPGVGKSTFLDAFGEHLTAAGLRIAVLAIDPTSSRSGGSILGDKTRMEQLSRNPQAFIRPSPGGLHPGGVARRTRETVTLCEAAGFDVILIETIGIGQSEISVADLVDTVILMVLAGAGDELQGIKRGIMELADILLVHKADGDNATPAALAATELAGAIRLLPRRFDSWQPTVHTCSAQTGSGIAETYQRVLDHRRALGEPGIEELRRQQSVQGFEDTLRDLVVSEFLSRPQVASQLDQLRRQVHDGSLHPRAAASRLTALLAPGTE